jgi:hypothetical protein
MLGSKDEGKSYHPVFVELGRWAANGKEANNMKPWSDESR